MQNAILQELKNGYIIVEPMDSEDQIRGNVKETQYIKGSFVSR